MTSSLLVNGLVKRLESVGYRSLSTPFKVASVEFEFTAALHGTAGRGLDLVLIVDTATGDHGDREAPRVRQRIEALSRALDITSSRYVLTAIFAGASLPRDVDSVSSTCRVLTIDHAALNGEGQPANAASAELLDDHIRVLLPLELRNDDATEAFEGDPVAELLSDLPPTLDEELVLDVTDASIRGEDAVTRALGKRLEKALSQDNVP